MLNHGSGSDPAQPLTPTQFQASLPRWATGSPYHSWPMTLNLLLIDLILQPFRFDNPRHRLTIIIQHHLGRSHCFELPHSHASDPGKQTFRPISYQESLCLQESTNPRGYRKVPLEFGCELGLLRSKVQAGPGRARKAKGFQFVA